MINMKKKTKDHSTFWGWVTVIIILFGMWEVAGVIFQPRPPTIFCRKNGYDGWVNIIQHNQTQYVRCSRQIACDVTQEDFDTGADITTTCRERMWFAFNGTA